MVENSAAGLSLFDLLGRDWALDDAIDQVIFNEDDSCAVFKLTSGKLALAAIEDAESPKIRTRMDLETGRTTIRPRENPITPVKTPDISVCPKLSIVRFGTQGFAAICEDGVLRQITAGGQVVDRRKSDGQTVTAIAGTRKGDQIAIAKGTLIEVVSTSELTAIAEFTPDHSVACMSYSDDGRTLAAWGDGKLSVFGVSDPGMDFATYDVASEITEIGWRDTGSHLCCASTDNSFYLIDRVEGSSQRVEGYPAPVHNVAFSKSANALVTSGAFRLVGWDANDLPQNDEPGTPITTGKPGFVVLNAIAAHPERDVVATGYASGLVTLASVGTPQDMMLHQERGTEVSSLCWSKTGEHLAIGFASGKAAIATFPSQLFK
ncbi:WD40 repeat domain-containing protein [Ruegeria sp. EL01]|jgi:WD40 repeat protein|uniref:WD40 repeat domain-containing protein n=1 Tax=Ruegeria sp. EL01 TaxID=2107578 RepID=UPI000EA7FA3D|nr:hypothetical protein [Ruegeria sp. EL01]